MLVIRKIIWDVENAAYDLLYFPLQVWNVQSFTIDIFAYKKLNNVLSEEWSKTKYKGEMFFPNDISMQF